MKLINKTGKARSPAVDFHTHLFPTFYIDLLQGRTEVSCNKGVMYLEPGGGQVQCGWLGKAGVLLLFKNLLYSNNRCSY